MKKMIVALAIAVSAAIAQAASVQWTVTNIYKDSTNKAATTDGFMVYLINDAEYSQSDAAAALAAGTLTTSTISSKAVASSGLTVDGKVSKAGTDVGDLANGTYYFYNVIVGGDNAVVGSTVKLEVTPVGDPQLGSFNAKTLTQDSSNWKSVTGGGGGGGGDGPEPTSGLLLLVGAGILGLRRKRA